MINITFENEGNSQLELFEKEDNKLEDSKVFNKRNGRVSNLLQYQLLAEEVEDPKYAKPGDAGLDLRSAEELIIGPGDKALVSTGIKLAVPTKHVGLIWDRSGLAANYGIHCLAGVIDSGFRGELKIVLHNLGHEPFKIEKGMRIAQLLIQPVVFVKLKRVKQLEETERGESGFGSTGII